MLALAVTAEGFLPAPQLVEVPEPVDSERELLVEALVLGICGTDRSMLARTHRQLPAGRDWMIIGHESLGRVLSAPSGSGFSPGDAVAGVVRRPDPLPCEYCAQGEIDLCLRGDYTESGIAGRDGYGSERYRLEPQHAVRVDPALGLAGVLVEPASIVAKAWERIDAIGRTGGRALILGAGPIGLLAALLGVQRGYDVHVVDRVAGGPKPDRVRELGASYHRGLESAMGRFEAVVECAGQLVLEAIECTATAGVCCLVAGVYTGSEQTLDIRRLSADMVGGNKVLTAISSSNRRHFQSAQDALAQAPAGWATRLMTRTVPLQRHQEAYAPDLGGIKSVVHFEGAVTCG